MLGPCPKCGEDVYEDVNNFFCISGDCDFEIKKTILGQKIESDQVVKLLTVSKTDLLTGFISKSGKKFPAYLVLGADENEPHKITLEFPDQDEETPPAFEANELKEIGRKLFQAKKFAEAIPLLKSAAEAMPKDEILWQELVMAARDNKEPERAVEFAKQAIRHHPKSDWLWRIMGSQLIEIDELDEAEKALDNSHNADSKNGDQTARLRMSSNRLDLSSHSAPPASNASRRRRASDLSLVASESRTRCLV